MTTSHAASSAAPAEKQASKYVLQDWEPNNPEKWDSKLAWRTLTITHILAHSGLLCVVPAKCHRTQADASWI